MYYTNQKQITIKKERVEGSKKYQQPYLIAYKANLEDAMKDLTATAFKVYICLLCNKNNYTIEYSPEHISRVTGICKDSARKALVQLEQKGYLKQINDHRYIFRESTITVAFEDEKVEGDKYYEDK